MAEPKEPQLNKEAELPKPIEPTPEEKLKDLERQIEEKRAELESLRDKSPFGKQASRLPASPPLKISPFEVKRKAKELKHLEQEKQVEILVNLVFEKSISHAVEVAKNLENPFILKEIHDHLILHFDELVKSGKLTPL